MKKFNRLLTGAFASVALLISASANAAIVVTEGGASASDGSNLVSSFAATTYNFNTGDVSIFTPTGQFEAVSGSLSGQYAQPFSDTTTYATLGTLTQPGTASLSTVPSDTHYVGLYWGSIDQYNSITITDSSGSHVVDSNTFAILNPANGDQGLQGSAYVNIFDNLAITGITFFSDHQAFEFDNLTVSSAVPETSTWAMMILGFFGVGFMAYRRKGGAPRLRIV